MSENKGSGCLTLLRPTMVIGCGAALVIFERMNRRNHHEWNDIPVSWIGMGFMFMGTAALLIMIPFVLRDWWKSRST